MLIGNPVFDPNQQEVGVAEEIGVPVDSRVVKLYLLVDCCCVDTSAHNAVGITSLSLSRIDVRGSPYSHIFHNPLILLSL